MRRGRPWRWRNLPLPEAHLLLLAGGTLLQSMAPKRMRRGAFGRVLGWMLLVGGTALAVQATRASGRIDLAHPAELVTHGPYARSRHPMYVGWTLIYGGLTLITGNRWLVLLLPGLLGLVHLEATREERALRHDFGAGYDDYRSRVRRYL